MKPEKNRPSMGKLAPIVVNFNYGKDELVSIVYKHLTIANFTFVKLPMQAYERLPKSIILHGLNEFLHELYVLTIDDQRLVRVVYPLLTESRNYEDSIPAIRYKPAIKTPQEEMKAEKAVTRSLHREFNQTHRRNSDDTVIIGPKTINRVASTEETPMPRTVTYDDVPWATKTSYTSDTAAHKSDGSSYNQKHSTHHDNPKLLNHDSEFYLRMLEMESWIRDQQQKTKETFANGHLEQKRNSVAGEQESLRKSVNPSLKAPDTVTSASTTQKPKRKKQPPVQDPDSSESE
jgi:hypothetical protein